MDVEVGRKAGEPGPPATEVEPTAVPYGKPAYAWYVLAILTLMYACHAIDRGMPSILLEPIRHEFGLSDSQLGLFSGLGFAVAFSIAVLPMGYVSDRVHRRNFLALIVMLWSVCTALAGFAHTYVQLVAARFGVGLAESGAAPVAVPMISDIFPPKRRGAALGFFYMSTSLGLFAVNFGGGFVAAEYGWRSAFFLAGVPGIVLALLLLTTVREPRRGGMEAGKAPAQVGPPPKLREILGFLAASPGLLVLILGSSLLALVSSTTGVWIGSFMIRAHGLDLKQVGLVLGLGGGMASLIGPPIMGWLGDKLGRGNPRGPLILVAACAMISLVFGLMMLFSAGVSASIAGFVLMIFFKNGYAAPLYAVIMGQTPARLRGTTMSVVQLLANLFGFGVGPVLVGVLSDAYGGGVALRYAIADALAVLPVVTVLLLVAMRMLYRAEPGAVQDARREAPAQS